MRICVPTGNDAGIDAPVHPHFGSAPYFSLLDTDTGGVEVLDNHDLPHEHGHCHPVGQLTGVDLDAVVVRGMGRGALARLTEAGIQVLVTDAPTLRHVLTSLRAGDLRALDPEAVCRGHAHAGSHNHPRA
jgi:predicted Fe-Mo cluster-binding NifX family protein